MYARNIFKVGFDSVTFPKVVDFLHECFKSMCVHQTLLSIVLLYVYQFRKADIASETIHVNTTTNLEKDQPL